MNSFVLHLQGSTRYEKAEGVTSFVGEDASGSFGLMANHGRFMTSLVFGLARFRAGADPWQYLALPGALLYFENNELFITARRFLRDADYTRISGLLLDELLREEEDLGEIRQSLRHLEEEMLKRIWRISQESGGST